MRHASWLKPMEPCAPKEGHVARPLRGMSDDLYKATRKPNKSEKR